MQLLVSVSSVAEVEAALAGGADIIDVKNPREGSLGAPLPRVIREVRKLAPEDTPVSTAIGDLPDLPGTAALAAAAAAACGADYVKVGLMGPASPDNAKRLLSASVQAVREVSPDTRVIAAAYADGESVGAVAPRHIVDIARSANADGCMLDTARKGFGSLFDCLAHEDLATFVAGCRRHGLLSAVAGSLAASHMPAVVGLGPDIVGVRSAACRGTREDGCIDSGLVLSLRRALTATALP